MNEALLISNLVLWLVVVVLILLVFALSRQVGILHERVAPAGALQPTGGPKIGELTKALGLMSLQGSPVTIGGENREGRHTFVLFISPTCPVCKSLVPTAISLIGSEKSRMGLVFASDGSETGQELDRHHRYVDKLNITRYPYLLSQELGMTYEVSRLPFAVLIGADGVLKGKGLVNTREHMESLINSMDYDIANLQEFMQKRSEDESKVQQYEPKLMEHTP